MTFHKASDHTSKLVNAIKALADLGVDEVLTQGGKGSALSSANIEAIR